MILARHAEGETNRTIRMPGGNFEAPLSENGVAQAFGMATRIRESGQRIVAVACSTNFRAIVTAGIVARMLGLEFPTRDARFNERGFPEGFGKDRASAAILARLEEWMPVGDLPDGIETERAVFERMRDGVTDLRARHGSEIVIVSHQLAIEALLSGNGKPAIRLGLGQFVDPETKAPRAI